MSRSSEIVETELNPKENISVGNSNENSGVRKLDGVSIGEKIGQGSLLILVFSNEFFRIFW